MADLQLAMRPLEALSVKPVGHQGLGGGLGVSIHQLFCFIHSLHFLKPLCHLNICQRFSIWVLALKTSVSKLMHPDAAGPQLTYAIRPLDTGAPVLVREKMQSAGLTGRAGW